VVEDVAAMAAAAIASGAFGLAAVVSGLGSPVESGGSAEIGTCVTITVSAGFA
jgi:hypothetical protein